MVAVETAQLLVTAGLLLATIVYAYFTKRNVDASIRPHIKANLAYRGPNAVFLSITNTGSGAAHDVEASWSIGDFKKSWTIPLMLTGERHVFPVLKEGQEWVIGTEDLKDRLGDGASQVLRFKASAEDPLGRSALFEEEMDILRIIESREGAHEVYQEDYEKEIHRELKKIRKDWDDVSRRFNQLSRKMKWKLDRERFDRLRDVIRDRQELGINELANLSGMAPHEMEWEVDKLQQLGLVEYDEEDSRVRWTGEPNQES